MNGLPEMHGGDALRALPPTAPPSDHWCDLCGERCDLDAEVYRVTAQVICPLCLEELTYGN